MGIAVFRAYCPDHQCEATYCSSLRILEHELIMLQIYMAVVCKSAFQPDPAPSSGNNNSNV
jgi:hypothetical protein